MHPMLNIGVRAARAAGDVIVRNLDRLDTLTVEKKQRNDYVSEVDHKAEQAVLQILQKAYPDHTFIGEESGQQGPDGGEFIWYIDPLDGTTNFLHGLPHFCVSIALQVKGRLNQAVVYDPVSQELFTASKGEGAWLNNKRLRVSRVNSLDNALIGTGFPYRDGDDINTYMRVLRQFTLKSAGIRRPGAAALDLAWLAAGRLDGFWLPKLQTWDMAAGGLIVREAGGLVNDMEGGDQWMQRGEIVAASPKIMHSMLQILKPKSTPAREG